MLIYRPVSSRPLKFRAERTFLSPCSVATTPLRICILHVCILVTSRPWNEGPLCNSPSPDNFYFHRVSNSHSLLEMLLSQCKCFRRINESWELKPIGIAMDDLVLCRWDPASGHHLQTLGLRSLRCRMRDLENSQKNSPTRTLFGCSVFIPNATRGL